MLSKTHTAFLLSLSLCLAGVSCRKTHVYPQMDSNALMQLVRAYNPNKHAGQVPQAAQVPAAAVQPAVQAAVAPEKLPTQLEYASPIKQAFSQGKFDDLERTIREARETKGRIVGGNWKIIEFYTDVYETFLTPTSQESDWKMFFDTLNQWIAAKPESAAARISLAQAYVGYAWQARGHGYANTVSDDAWDLFNERTAMAAATLADAARLKEKCPYWYETMQTVALAQGWDKSLARELMEDAVAYEPDYYHFYREHANFLQTKWYGEEGEVESFIAWAARKATFFILRSPAWSRASAMRTTMLCRICPGQESSRAIRRWDSFTESPQ